MRRLLLRAAVAVAALAAWIAFERAHGPVAEPIPSVLPHYARRPPPLRAAFPAAQAASNPGEGVWRLHARGITGRDVGIGIIDRPLLTEHREYADRLRWYDEIDPVFGEPAGWHSTAVASIAAGRNVDVVAAQRAAHTGLPLALAIRVISISIGGGAETAIAEAREAGNFVSAIDLHPAPIGPVAIASPAVSWAIA